MSINQSNKSLFSSVHSVKAT